MTKFEKRQKMWEYCINNLPFSDDDFNTRRRNKYDFMNKDRNPNEQVHDVMTFGTALMRIYIRMSRYFYNIQEINFAMSKIFCIFA